MLATVRKYLSALLVLLLIGTLCAACGSKNTTPFDPTILDAVSPSPDDIGDPDDPPSGENPVDPPSGEDPVDPPSGEDPVDPPSGEDPVDPPSGEDPVDPPSGEDPVDPPSGEDPVDPPVVEPKPNPDAGLTLHAYACTLNVDDIFVLKANYIPKFETDDVSLIWKSSNDSVVSVTGEGVLRAKTVGEVTITCQNTDGNFRAECVVTVKLMWKNYTFDFKTDLSDYEWAMNPESDAYVFLVNKDNPVDKNSTPTDLVDIRDTRTDRAKQKMRKIAEAALHALFLEAKENGILYVHKQLYSDGYYYNNVLSVTSAYRSYNQQANNFNNKVNSILKANPSYTREQAEAIAATTINRPGTSEHQTGLCVDMHNYRYAEKEIAEEFGNSVAGKWLAENCYKFGFILRYEADKTDITGIAYESWHFRYVGRYHATRMHELDMCLEEYTEYLTEMGYEFDLAE